VASNEYDLYQGDRIVVTGFGAGKNDLNGDYAHYDDLTVEGYTKLYNVDTNKELLFVPDDYYVNKYIGKWKTDEGDEMTACEHYMCLFY